jgi:catechol 2,3-dioxygenase-like lactoylglutathione lyase family enzyme
MTASLHPEPSSIRRLDHLVLPVATLSASRDFFEALGFVVAPDAVHPFGTANACVFFADGTYLEPLAVADSGLCRDQAIAGNTFVARDRAFRARRGEPGFSGIAFASDSAEADHAAFATAGLADGEIFEFSRVFVTAGAEKTLTFRLAFAGDRRVPDLFFFACQAMVPKGDRSALTGHANGVTGIRRLVLSEPKPDDFATLLQDVTGAAETTATANGLSVGLANGAIEALDAAGMAGRYGRGRDAERGLRFEGVVLSVPDLDMVRGIAAMAGLAAREIDGRLVVDLIGSERGFFAFEAE